MVCVYCNSPTQVVNSRHQRRSNDIWRRRKCTACGIVFTSLESADLASALRVEHSPHRLESFQRDKLFISIYASCKHRPTAIRDAANLTRQVIAHLLASPAQPGLIGREDIIEACKKTLRPFDAAAATSYEAFHRH